MELRSMEALGVSHPIPTKFAERIYNEGKTVFVSRVCLKRVSQGQKFIIYESYGAKAYTGWADIKTIGKQNTSSILKKYKSKLMVSTEEFKQYSKGQTKMNVIEFENFEKFNKPVKPKNFVTVGGKYIYKEEFQMIKRNKD